MSVRMVCGVRFCTSRPQASPVWMTAAPEMTRAAVPTPARNRRRSTPMLPPPILLLSGVIAFPPLFCDQNLSRSARRRSAVTSVSLQDFDLVAVGVLHEEEPRHQRAVAEELLDRVRSE